MATTRIMPLHIGKGRTESQAISDIIDYVASEKWGVTPRQINYLCAGGRIPGAVKKATIWLIPKDAEKPADRRFKNTKK